jgi:hypothetical protein
MQPNNFTVFTPLTPATHKSRAFLARSLQSRCGFKSDWDGLPNGAHYSVVCTAEMDLWVVVGDEVVMSANQGFKKFTLDSAPVPTNHDAEDGDSDIRESTEQQIERGLDTDAARSLLPKEAAPSPLWSIPSMGGEVSALTNPTSQQRRVVQQPALPMYYKTPQYKIISN